MKGLTRVVLGSIAGGLLGAAAFFAVDALVPAPSSAGLGAATSSTPKTYKAWCGRKGNNCKVSFADGKITVNNKDSINHDQLSFIHGLRDYECKPLGGCHWILTYNVEYIEHDKRNFAKFIFMHLETGKQFHSDLMRVCKECRERPKVHEVKVLDY